jgi:surface polysaccharide O-acyltransferase-like enzyme
MTTVGVGPGVALEAEPVAPARLLFVDNIRVFLTVLVILHHLMITYAGTGSWYYQEGREDAVVEGIGGWFCSINQAYFMGLFLLISACFIPGSYDRKGAGRFVKDRLIRLGIPLLVFSWVINPLFVYWFFDVDRRMPFWSFFAGEYFDGGALIGQGPLWFVEVLLIFSLVYVAWRMIVPRAPLPSVTASPFPRDRMVVLFALGLGVAAALLRIPFAIDAYWFAALNLQLGFFASYVALFVVGLIAYRRDWLRGLSDTTGRRWLRVAVLMVLLWPPTVIALGATDDDLPLKGGLHWQSPVYALWEAFACVSLCIAVIYLFRRHLDRRGRVAAFLVPNAYTAYLIHAPVIATLAWGLRDLTWYPLLKWALVSLIAVPLCFGLSALIRKIPYTDRAL